MAQSEFERERSEILRLVKCVEYRLEHDESLQQAERVELMRLRDGLMGRGRVLVAAQSARPLVRDDI